MFAASFRVGSGNLRPQSYRPALRRIGINLTAPLSAVPQSPTQCATRGVGLPHSAQNLPFTTRPHPHRAAACDDLDGSTPISVPDT